jgi:AbrB family looped-hinge helix DNA binding protein
MTSRGRLTVPREVRMHLNLRPGDRLSFVWLEYGAVKIEAQARYAAIRSSSSSALGTSL